MCTFIRCRIFDKKGQHVGGAKFGINLSDILAMKFYSDDVNVSLHWSGDQERQSELFIDAFP